MKIRDISPWHHLIFVEELTDDFRDIALCYLCWEQAVGPVYICLECGFIQHKSCPNPTSGYWKSCMKDHNYDSRHHLMLVEEVESRVTEAVVCWKCQEPPYLPAYKCSIPGCAFLLHKSCAELSHAVLHPQHSDHVLTLQARDLAWRSRGKYERCNACNKPIKCLYYGCRRCNVCLHPKCFAPEMGLELKPEPEPQPEPEDRSPWHHLIFVEELAYKDKCSLCEEQAAGPVYKCLELGCGFIIHKSCPTKRDWKERVKDIHSSRRHELILVEEVENRAEEEVCWGCEEPTSLPAYKCALPGCTFILHKSCTELPLNVLHLQHADHVLTLHSSSKVKCNFCLKTKKSLLYGCYPCNFDLHIKCLSPSNWLPRLSFVADDCHEHAILPTSMLDPFTCQACGEEGKCSACFCVICRLIMHKSCCDFPHSIQTTVHGPSLIFIHSVRLINKDDRIFCRLCRKLVNTRYGAYYCVKCGYILHLKCARRYKDKDSTSESMSSNCEEYTIYLLDWLKAAEDERVDELEKFKHFDHPSHDLILSHKHPGYDKKCKACLNFIFFTPYYSCGECNFFLHVRCAKLPTIIKRGLLHEHPLTLTTTYWSYCDVCYNNREGYGYKCDKCDKFEADVKCGSLPEALEHVLHRHILFLVRRFMRPEEKCNVCGLSVRYVCTVCEFGLCGGCVALPPKVRYQYHPHLLSVTFVDEDQEDNYCLICEKKFYSKKLFYWCKECDFTVHSECILKGKIFNIL